MHVPFAAEQSRKHVFLSPIDVNMLSAVAQSPEYLSDGGNVAAFLRVRNARGTEARHFSDQT